MRSAMTLLGAWLLAASLSAQAPTEDQLLRWMDKIAQGQLDARDQEIAAVRNVIQPAMHGHVSSIGISDPREYFNAGVLLFDMNRMRADDVVGRVCQRVV